MSTLSTTTFRLTKYIDVDGIEHPTQIQLSLDRPLLKTVFAYVHPKQIHKLRLLSKIFNDLIMTPEFAFENIKNFVPLSAPATGDELGDLRQQLDRMTTGTHKRGSLRYNKPNEFQELFFQWPEVYQRVFAQHFYKHTTSIGKVIGFGRGLPLLIPHQIGELTQLVRLDLGMCGISGEIPSAVTELHKLEFLDLSRNHLKGVIPNGFGTLVQLKFLDLQDNGLVGSIPASLGRLLNLTSLHLNTNALTGGIPKDLGKLSKLAKLDLSKNQLSETIPVELFSLTSLTELRLNNNALTGAIPVEIANLTQLRSLYFAKNGLSGEIPHTVGALIQLRHFVVNSNKLGGPIPEALQKMEYLEVCNLKNNGEFTCDFEFDFAY
ncbi:UNVERIFIED_CONTAM: hypothetical protein HDU68_010494 [Siphonaria sp. JEL0065]|nr:hypothetical protein HDU68_010494 [Siphonaria sp. JEL0065]